MGVVHVLKQFDYGLFKGVFIEKHTAMKNQIINEIQRKMLPYLNNEQLLHLKAVLEASFQGVIIEMGEEQPKAEEQDSAAAFITAKRIEGCSEKTLTYYSKTIEAMLNDVGKSPQQITTDDLRKYLTDYQTQRRSSKVTIDNIRRILSSFFSWLEDEDFIVKSPVRRIHKVKTAKIIKETYTDEALELMRDNCSTVRDLAIIDLLASSGMRVGELVTLNREDSQIVRDILKKKINPILFDECYVAVQESLIPDWYNKEIGQSKARKALADTLQKYSSMERPMAKTVSKSIIDDIVDAITKELEKNQD